MLISTFQMKNYKSEDTRRKNTSRKNTKRNNTNRNNSNRKILIEHKYNSGNTIRKIQIDKYNSENVSRESINNK